MRLFRYDRDNRHGNTDDGQRKKRHSGRLSVDQQFEPSVCRANRKWKDSDRNGETFEEHAEEVYLRFDHLLCQN